MAGLNIFNNFRLYFVLNIHLLFDPQIWLGVVISTVCVIAVLNSIQQYLEYRSVYENTFRSSDNTPTQKIVNKGETGKQYLYVFGNLLSQGTTNEIKRLLTPVRRPIV